MATQGRGRMAAVATDTETENNSLTTRRTRRVRGAEVFKAQKLLFDGPLMARGVKLSKNQHAARVRWLRQIVAPIEMDPRARKELEANIAQIEKFGFTLIDEANVKGHLLREINREITIINKKGFVPERTIITEAKSRVQRRPVSTRERAYATLVVIKDMVVDQLMKAYEALTQRFSSLKEEFA